jgi:hypothetical protein
VKPQIYHVLSQKKWPGIGAGEFDDCWVLASLQAVHAVAPWLKLPGSAEFRSHTGVLNQPDEENPGTAKNMGAGIRGSFPGLKVQVVNENDSMSFATFASTVKLGRPAALIVKSGDLPAGQRFGFAGIHAITVAFVDNKWHVLNPLAQPHTKPVTMAEADIRKASKGFASVVHAVIMPTIEEALATHESHAAQVAGLETRIKRLMRKLADAGISAANL